MKSTTFDLDRRSFGIRWMIRKENQFLLYSLRECDVLNVVVRIYSHGRIEDADTIWNWSIFPVHSVDWDWKKRRVVSTAMVLALVAWALHINDLRYIPNLKQPPVSWKAYSSSLLNYIVTFALALGFGKPYAAANGAPAALLCSSFIAKFLPGAFVWWDRFVWLSLSLALFGQYFVNGIYYGKRNTEWDSSFHVVLLDFLINTSLHLDGRSESSRGRHLIRKDMLWSTVN